MNWGGGERGRERVAKHRLSAATTSESWRRRLVLERQRLINPMREQSQWERSRGCEKWKRDRQSAVEQRGEQGGERQPEQAKPGSTHFQRAHPGEWITAHQTEPLSLCDWLTNVEVCLECASQLTVCVWRGGLGLAEEGSTNPPTLGEASHSFGTCPEDFSVLRERREEEESVWGAFAVTSAMSMLIATQQIDTTTSKMVRMKLHSYCSVRTEELLSRIFGCDCSLVFVMMSLLY